MSVVNYMNLNGVMQGRARPERRFILPDRSNVARSVRFGAHAVALKETMQIIPVAGYDRLRARPAFEPGVQAQTKTFIKTILNGLNVRSLLM